MSTYQEGGTCNVDPLLKRGDSDPRCIDGTIWDLILLTEGGQVIIISSLLHQFSLNIFRHESATSLKVKWGLRGQLYHLSVLHFDFIQISLGRARGKWYLTNKLRKCDLMPAQGEQNDLQSKGVIFRVIFQDVMTSLPLRIHDKTGGFDPAISASAQSGSLYPAYLNPSCPSS